MITKMKFAILSIIGIQIVFGASIPKSVGQTKKEETTSQSTLKSLNDILRSLTSGDPSLNGHVSRALDDFVSTVLPAHCQQIQQMQSKFFDNLRKTTKLKLDTQTTDAFEELMLSMMPAVCGKDTARNLVSKSATTNTLFNQLDRFGALLKINDKNLDGSVAATAVE